MRDDALTPPASAGGDWITRAIARGHKFVIVDRHYKPPIDREAVKRMETFFRLGEHDEEWEEHKRWCDALTRAEERDRFE